jgi:sporulation integral membrane protein YtvI
VSDIVSKTRHTKQINAYNKPYTLQEVDRVDERKYLIRIVGTTIGIYIAFKYLLPLVVPFVLAFIFAKLLNPVMNFLNKKWHISRRVSSPILLILAIVILGAFLGYILVAVIQQIALVIRNIPRYQNLWCDNMGVFCNCCEHTFGISEGSMMRVITENSGKVWGGISGRLYPNLAGVAAQGAFRIGRFGIAFFIFFISTIMLMVSEGKEENAEKRFPFYHKWKPILSQLRKTAFAYIRAQSIIIFIVSGVCAGALFLLRNPYAILFGLAIGIVDAFPIVGSGSVLVPWSLFYVLSGNFKNAAILFSAYLVTFFIRELLEPRLLGNKLGISSFVMMMALVVGVKLFGIAGIVLGPIGAVIISTVAKSGLDKCEDGDYNQV